MLFGSEKQEYKGLHNDIIKYVRFLDRCNKEEYLSDGQIEELFYFKETKENWLGFSWMSNEGRGLGRVFAEALRKNFDALEAAEGVGNPHLERIGLVDSKLGRDGVSDLTTQLIKCFLLRFTEEFATRHLPPDRCRHVNVERVTFNYERKIWEAKSFYLPLFGHQHIILTP